MDVFTTGAVFVGTLDSLSRAFRLGPDDFQACLLELASASQIVVRQEGARLTLRLERRSGEDRRRPAAGTRSP